MAAGGGYLAYIGAFYPTGRQYYEVCWAKEKAKQSHASDAYQDVIWGNCDNIAARAIFSLGILGPFDDVVDPNLKRKDKEALQAVCPGRARSSAPEIIDAVQAGGGPILIDA